MSQSWRNILAPAGVWIHQRLTASSEKTIEQYYEDLTKSKLSTDLIVSLEKLESSQQHLRAIFKKYSVSDRDGKPHWQQDRFKQWMTRNQPHQVINAFIPKLWHIFVYFAGFPFTERILCDSETSDQCITEDGFVQAYILLSLRGVEILGNTKDGWTPKGAVENTWSQKSPRLVTLLFDGLKEEDQRSQGLINRDPANHAEEQLMNAIVLTQPAPHMAGLSFEKDLRGAARRLLMDNVAPSYNKPASLAVPRDDLHTFIQLSLLLRLSDSPWKRGLILHDTTRICGDIEHLGLVTDEEEITLSIRLSRAITKHGLGDVASISRQSFDSFCEVYVCISTST
jgi:hypothetical protein